MTKKQMLALLEDWDALFAFLVSNKCTEAIAGELLAMEKVGKKRPSALTRIYSNYSVRRAKREREELRRLTQ